MMEQPPNQQYPQFQQPLQQQRQPPSQPLSEQQQWPLPSQPLPPQQQWQQQTNYTQPQSYYPPPQQKQPQLQQNKPQQSPTKASTRRLSPKPAWQWILVGLIVGIFIGYAIHEPSSQSSNDSTTTSTQNTAQPTSQPTQAPTQLAVTPTPIHTPKWTTVQTITGNGNKKTAIFAAPSDWKIIWSCSGFNDGSGVDGALTVTVYNADGTPGDIGAVNATCKAGSAKTTGDTEEHQGGSVYLDIGATGDWTIQVQELK